MSTGQIAIESCIDLIRIILYVLEWTKSRSLKIVWIPNRFCRWSTILYIGPCVLGLILVLADSVGRAVQRIQVVPELIDRERKWCVDCNFMIRQTMDNTSCF